MKFLFTCLVLPTRDSVYLLYVYIYIYQLGMYLLCYVGMHCVRQGHRIAYDTAISIPLNQ